MKYLNKQSFCYRIILSGILMILLSWLVSSAGVAKEATPPALAGFVVSTLSPELAEDLGLPREQRGVIIMAIAQGSPAEKVDLHEGDIIVEVQNNKGKMVDITDNQQYQVAADSVPTVKPLVLTILREGKKQTLQLLRSSDKLGSFNQPSPAATPQTIKVVSDGSGDCKSIDGALLRSRPGDTILIKAGIYGSITI
jgi:membrane-associated protease RseP (regulator of RpoE activity)